MRINRSLRTLIGSEIPDAQLVAPLKELAAAGFVFAHGGWLNAVMMLTSDQANVISGC